MPQPRGALKVIKCDLYLFPDAEIHLRFPQVLCRKICTAKNNSGKNAPSRNFGLAIFNHFFDFGGVRKIDDFARHELFFDILIRSIYQNSKNANLRKTSDSKMNAFAPSRSRSRFGWEMYSRLERSEGPFVQHV